MLRILRKTAASMAKSAGSGAADPCMVFDMEDLSAWEFVNASLSDDEDVFSFDGDVGTIEEDGGSIAEEVAKEPLRGEGDDEHARSSRGCVSPKVIFSVKCLSASPRSIFDVEMRPDREYGYGGDGCSVDDDDDDDHDLDDYDFDDELVPWKLKHMVGKQRIRKMGKRGGPKLSKSKKLPYYHNRPGCLYGKHGFGVQHNFI